MSTTSIENKISTNIGAAPVLSRKWLITLLAVMCCVPVITIAVLWQILPPVYEHELPAAVRFEGIPSAAYYEIDVKDRDPVQKAILVLKNEGDEEWTNMIIRINRTYMAYEKDKPLAPGEEQVFDLNRFQTRRAVFFDLKYHRINNIQVYARLPSGARATYDVDYPSD